MVLVSDIFDGYSEHVAQACREIGLVEEKKIVTALYYSQMP